MRAYELYETDPIALGIYDPTANQSVPKLSDTRKPKITLELLNRLKKIRIRRRSEKLKKLEFYPVIYGDRDKQDEFELQKRELEQIKDEISLEKEAIELEIDKASIAEKDREHLRSLANRTLKRLVK